VAIAALAAAVTARSPATAAASTLLLLLGLFTGRSVPVFLALLLLAAIYVVPEGDRAIPAPIYGGALLLIAELAFWSLDELGPGRLEPGTLTPRLVAILAVAATAVAAGALVSLAADSEVARSPALTAAGVGAILACIGVLVALVRARDDGHRAAARTAADAVSRGRTLLAPRARGRRRARRSR
jgi:hypothetical protein